VPVVEASVIAGVVIGWAVRKARRAAGRLDETVDAAIDAGAGRLHEVVLARLGDPVREELAEEAASESGQVSELTRQQIEVAVAATARRDADFARAVSELLAQVRQAQPAVGVQVWAGPGSTVFTGDATATARGGIAVGQAGAMNVREADRGGPDPTQPGRPSH
jgi:hypothetical protein